MNFLPHNRFFDVGHNLKKIENKYYVVAIEIGEYSWCFKMDWMVREEECTKIPLLESCPPSITTRAFPRGILHVGWTSFEPLKHVIHKVGAAFVKGNLGCTMQYLREKIT